MLAWWITGDSLSRVDVWGLDWLLSFTLVSALFAAFAVGGVANVQSGAYKDWVAKQYEELEA